MKESQYMVGDNGVKRRYVVGFGEKGGKDGEDGSGDG